MGFRSEPVAADSKHDAFSKMTQNVWRGKAGRMASTSRGVRSIAEADAPADAGTVTVDVPWRTVPSSVYIARSPIGRRRGDETLLDDHRSRRRVEAASRSSLAAIASRSSLTPAFFRAIKSPVVGGCATPRVRM